MATQIEQFVVAFETTGSKKAEGAFKDISKAASNAEQKVEGLQKQTQKTTRVFKGFRGATSALTNTTGQLSVQVQDVAVQLESGTDAVRVFAQQGPQIAAIFGPSGAAFGAILAIGALIGGPFIRQLFAANEAVKQTRKELSEISDEFHKLSEAEKTAKLELVTKQMKDLQMATKATEKELVEQKSRFRELREETPDLIESFGEIISGNFSLKEAKVSSRVAVNELTATLARQKRQMEELTETSKILMGTEKEKTKEDEKREEALRNHLEALEKQFATLGMNAEQLAVYTALQNGATVSDIRAIRAIFEKTEAFKAQQEELKKNQAAQEQAEESLEKFIKRQEELADQSQMSITMKLLTQATIEATKAGRELTIEEFNRINAVAQKLQQIEDEKEALKSKAELEKTLKKQAAEAERQLQKDIAEARKKREAEDKVVQQRVKMMEQAEKELKREGLLDVEKDEIDSFTRRLKKIEEFKKKELITEKQAAEAKQNLNKQVQDYAIDSAAKGLQAMGQYNKTAFEASKALETGRAVMQTYSGATKALAELPFPYNLVAAAGIVAFGLAQVAQIQSQQFQGRALGGQVRAGESYVVGERGPEILTMGANGRITPNDKIGGSESQTINKTANVNFTIVANDTDGFDNLLQSRRGQIIGIINEALNDQGRTAIA